MKISQVCPKCDELKFLTKHHIYPKRFFGKKNNNEVILLCCECHKKLERLIPNQEKLKKERYKEIAQNFLNSEELNCYKK